MGEWTELQEFQPQMLEDLGEFEDLMIDLAEGKIA